MLSSKTLILAILIDLPFCSGRTASKIYLNPSAAVNRASSNDPRSDGSDWSYGGNRGDHLGFGMMEPNFSDGIIDGEEALNSSVDSESRAFRRWLNTKMRTYDKRVRPDFGQRPLMVKLGIWLISISSISEANMEFTVEMYMHEFWQDPRLTFDPSQFGNRSQLTLPLEAPRFLWLPDTSFLNALRSQNPEAGSLSHLYYLKLYENGTVFYSRRLSVTVECHMDLTMYPFDRQACTLAISSYGLDTNDLLYEWTLHAKSVVIENIQLADFYAVSYAARVINRTYVAGNFSVPQLCFVFQRRSGFCYAQLFIPATAVVASSWISLWLESETQFSDMVAVILAIIFLSYTYNTIMPRVSYVKAMDIYLAGCFMFVFLSLVKLAIVKYMWKRMRKRDSFALCSLPDSAFELSESGSLGMQQQQKGIAGLFTGQHSMGGAAAINAGVAFSLDAFGAEALRRLNLKRLSTAGLQNGSAVNNRRKSTAAFLKVARVHDRYWRCAKAFHIGSQVVFPIMFAAFAIFFFLIYAKIYVPITDCFERE